MDSLTLMIIRHAEKPKGAWPGPGLTTKGEIDKKSLVIRGWQRAGAWSALFGTKSTFRNRVRSTLPTPIPARTMFQLMRRRRIPSPANGRSRRSRHSPTDASWCRSPHTPSGRKVIWSKKLRP